MSKTLSSLTQPARPVTQAAIRKALAAGEDPRVVAALATARAARS